MNAKFVISTSNGRDFVAWMIIGDPKKNDNWTKVATTAAARSGRSRG